MTNDKPFYIGSVKIEPLDINLNATPSEKVRQELASRFPVDKSVMEIPIDRWEDMLKGLQ